MPGTSFLGLRVFTVQKPLHLLHTSPSLVRVCHIYMAAPTLKRSSMTATLFFFVESENKLIGLQKEDATPAVFGGKHEDVSFCSFISQSDLYQFAYFFFFRFRLFVSRTSSFLKRFPPRAIYPWSPNTTRLFDAKTPPSAQSHTAPRLVIFDELSSVYFFYFLCRNVSNHICICASANQTSIARKFYFRSYARKLIS